MSSHFDELGPRRSADRAPLRRNPELNVTADGAKVEPGLGNVLVLLDGFERSPVKVRVHCLRFHGVAEHQSGAMGLSLGLFEHGRVHRRVLVGFARDGSFEILRSGADSGEALQMALGVDALGFGSSAEQARYVGKTFLLGFLGEGPVFLIGLALSGECFLEVVGSA